MHRLTHQNAYELYIELEDWVGNVRYARYSTFSVGPGDDYILSVGGYSGTAGDGLDGGLWTNNGGKFATRQWIEDICDGLGSIAEHYGGGWWYNLGSYSNLNGPYFRDTDSFDNDEGFGVLWSPFYADYYYSLKKTKMMVRPTDFSTRVANMKREQQ
ncbi:fibrinogen-like protein 1 [Branchiostoma floridae x Branchiostoma japonicum]